MEPGTICVPGFPIYIVIAKPVRRLVVAIRLTLLRCMEYVILILDKEL